MKIKQNLNQLLSLRYFYVIAGVLLFCYLNTVLLWSFRHGVDLNSFFATNAHQPGFKSFYLLGLLMVLIWTVKALLAIPMEKFLDLSKKLWWLNLALYGTLLLNSTKIISALNTPWLNLDFIAREAGTFQMVTVSFSLAFFTFLIFNNLFTKYDKKISPKTEKITLVSLFIIFSIILFFLLFFKHLYFDTFSRDLGIFDQAIWNLSKFKAPGSTIRGFSNLWGDHFHLILALFSPVFWIWNNVNALFLLQALAVASGIFPIYLMGKKLLGTKFAGLCFGLAYLLFIGLQNAVNFGFYPENFTSPILAFALYFIVIDKPIKSLPFFALLLITKETSSLYFVFIGIYLFLTNKRKFGLGLIAIGILWLFITTKWLIPHFAGFSYPYFTYEKLGNTPFRAVKTIITNPLYTLNVFTDAQEKMTTFLTIAGSFGFLSFFSPAILLALPMLGEQFLSNRWSTYHLGYHYASPSTVPLLFAAIFGILAIIKYKSLVKYADQLKMILPLGILLFGLIYNFSFDTPIHYSLLHKFFKTPTGLSSSFNKEISNVFKTIPPNASITTQDSIAPHLTHRTIILDHPNPYSAPYKLDVDYFLFVIHDPISVWPYSPDELKQKIQTIKDSGLYTTQIDNDGIILLKKNI